MRACLPVALWLAFPMSLVAACSEKAPGDTCFDRVRAPLTNATDQETYLGLDPRQRAAIVQVTDGSTSGGALCTGAFVTDEWVVTGAHCFQIESPVIRTGSSDEVPVVERIAHPTLDVALFRVSTSAPAGQRQPISVATTSELAVSIGSVVELAGYGLTETGDERELRFVVESIIEMDQRSFVVDGFGATGACLGDSGGPLLVRERAGPVRVAGVLTTGAATCVGRDRYVRLDALAEWVSGTVGSPAASDEPCGGITEEGRCLYGSAMFCDGGQLTAKACAEDAPCGWDQKTRSFRCVEAASNSCDGVDSVGACLDGVPRRCKAGVLEGEACTCGDVCRIDGKTGSPGCRSAELPTTQ